MSWLNNHAAELTALGGIFMNIATLIIIFFNLNQLKLNNRSLNVDINFKVFELRKKLYKDILNFIKSLNPEKGFKPYLSEDTNAGYNISEDFINLKESIDNCKYLFSGHLCLELELLLLNIEQGIAVEQRILKLKDKDSSEWSGADQIEINTLGEKRKDCIKSIIDFNHESFLSYLDISNFHENLMKESDVSPSLLKSIYKFLTFPKYAIHWLYTSLKKKEGFEPV